MGELINFGMALMALVIIGYLIRNVLKGAGKAGAGIGLGIGSAFAGLGKLFDGIGSGGGKAAKGAGGGIGSATKGAGSGIGSAAKGTASGLGSMLKGAGSGVANVAKGLPNAGKAAGSLLAGAGLGAAALGVAGARGVAKAAKGAGRRVKKAATYVKEDAMAGFATETPAGWARPEAWRWPVADPDAISSIFDRGGIPYGWERDSSGRWHVVIPSDAVDDAGEVLDAAGWEVTEPGQPASWNAETAGAGSWEPGVGERQTSTAEGPRTAEPEWTWRDRTPRRRGPAHPEPEDDEVVDAEWRPVVPALGSGDEHMMDVEGERL